MMLTKPKEMEEAAEEITTNTELLPPPPPPTLLQESTTDDLEKELERRLSMLGKTDDESKATTKQVDAVVEEKSTNNSNEGDLISFDEPQQPVVAPVMPLAPSVTTPFVAPVVKEIQAKKPAQAPAPSKPNKSALLVSNYDTKGKKVNENSLL